MKGRIEFWPTGYQVAIVCFLRDRKAAKKSAEQTGELVLVFVVPSRNLALFGINYARTSLHDLTGTPVRQRTFFPTSASSYVSHSISGSAQLSSE